MADRQNGYRSLSEVFTRQSWVIDVGVLCTAVALLVGCTAPLLTFRKFFIFSDTVSLVSALVELWMQGHIVLFLIIGLFSIAVPGSKLGALLWLWHAPYQRRAQQRRRLRALEMIGKWSMLDVFVVALLVVTAKLAGVASVEVRAGLYIFACAVLGTTLLTSRVRHLAEQAEQPTAADADHR